MSDPAEFRERMQRLETLIEEVEHFPDAVAREHTRQIVQAVLDMHAAGLERVIELLGEAGDTGTKLIDCLARDDVVSGLLLLYNLHPLGSEERVRLAVDRVGPTVRKHGGEVEFLGFAANRVRVRVQLNGHACGSTATNLRRLVEDAIYDKAPEISTIDVEGLPEPANGAGATFVPLEQLAASLSSK